MCSHCRWLLLECFIVGIRFNGAETNRQTKLLWNCTDFRHPTDQQLQHSYIFSNYYNLQSVHFEYIS